MLLTFADDRVLQLESDVVHGLSMTEHEFLMRLDSDMPIRAGSDVFDILCRLCPWRRRVLGRIELVQALLDGNAPPVVASIHHCSAM